MAPYANTRTRARAKPKAAYKEPRRTHFKKQQVKSKNIKEASMVVEDLPSCSSTTTASTNCSSANCLNIDHEFNFEGVDISTTTICSTPKAQRFRIPKIETCPPAPKKQRVISNCSLQRTPIAFFAPPDLELFFFYALGDISA